MELLSHRAGKCLTSVDCFPKALPILFLPPLVFEHITEELLHWSVPYGLAEKEELNAFRSDKPQRREEQKQFPKPKQERERTPLVLLLSECKSWGQCLRERQSREERRDEWYPG